MKSLEWKNEHRPAFPPGEWDGEPDKVQWPDAVTGLPCLIVRNHAGALCGYVGVPRSHRCYGRGYDDVDVRVHGGLTFSDSCQPDHGNHAQTICHVAPGEDDVWWLGFDCAHCGDLVPGMLEFRSRMRTEIPRDWPVETYRNVAYVKAQCLLLAHQLAAL